MIRSESETFYESLKKDLQVSKGYMLFMVLNSPCSDCDKCGGVVDLKDCKLLHDSTIRITSVVTGLSTYEIATLINNYLEKNLNVTEALHTINTLKIAGVLSQNNIKKENHNK